MAPRKLPALKKTAVKKTVTRRKTAVKVDTKPIMDERAARVAEAEVHGRRIDALVNQVSSHATHLASQGVLLTETTRRLEKLETKFIADPAVLVEGFAGTPDNLIHECVDGSHRILSVGKDGVKAGKWAARNEIAVLGELRASTSFFDGILPLGIFAVPSVDFNGLGG